tara:strand:+ start:2087 stop:3226 length:1140 start_codon:yes stop_codon:yes gene_type:complete
VGVWASLILMGFMDGIMVSRQSNGINRFYSHIQVENRSYDYDQNIGNALPQVKEIDKVLTNDTNIISYTDRFLLDVSLATARKQAGAKLIGIDAIKDKLTVDVYKKLEQGSFFGSKYKMPIVIGKKMADDLRVKLGSNINIQFINLDTTQVGKNFKVVGIFKTGDTGFDEYTVFVPHHSIYRLTKEKLVHRILVKTKDPENLISIKNELQQKMPDNVIVKTWRESAVVLASGEEMYSTMMFVIMLVIITALLFGIVNTIIMSILERQREIGILLAIGMNKNKVRMMIAFESMIYGIIGGPIGVLLGFLTVQYFTKYGLDLSAYGQGMSEFGLETVVHFSLDTSYYFIYGILISFSSFIAGLYPAWLATKINPVKAIQSI